MKQLKLLFTAGVLLLTLVSVGQPLKNDFIRQKSKQVFDTLHIQQGQVMVIAGQDGKRGVIVRTGAGEKYINDTLALYMYNGFMKDSIQLYEVLNIVPDEPNRPLKFITYTMDNPVFLTAHKRH